MNNLEDQVWHQMKYNFFGEIHTQIINQVSDNVWEKVYDRVRAPISRQVKNQFRTLLRIQIK